MVVIIRAFFWNGYSKEPAQVTLIKRMTPQILVWLLALEHVIDDDQDSVTDGYHCSPFPTTRPQALPLRAYIGIPGPHGSMSRFNQGLAQPSILFPRLAAEV